MYLDLDVEDSTTGRKLGAGPICTVTSWQYTSRLDAAGTFRVQVPPSDPVTALLTAKRTVRAWGPVAGARTELGSGILDQDALTQAGISAPTGTWSGPNRLDELTWSTVGSLQLRGADGAPTLHGLSQILAYAPEWSLDLQHGVGTTINPLYMQFQDETVLEALIKVATQTGEHFRLGEGRQIVWLGKTLKASGLRAIGGQDPTLGATVASNDPRLTEQCVITDLSLTQDTHDLIFRIIPYGAGSAGSRLTLFGATRALPAGYTSGNLASPDLTENWIEATAIRQAGGYPAISRVVSFSDVGTANTGALDATSAANSLFDAAVAHLARGASLPVTLTLKLVQVAQVLEPGTTLRVVWRGQVRAADGTPWRYVDIDADFFLLDVATDLDSAGRRVVTVNCSTVDRRPETDASYLARTVAQVRAQAQHPQPAGQVQTAAATLGAIIGRTAVRDPATGSITGYQPVYDHIT